MRKRRFAAHALPDGERLSDDPTGAFIWSGHSTNSSRTSPSSVPACSNTSPDTARWAWKACIRSAPSSSLLCHARSCAIAPSSSAAAKLAAADASELSRKQRCATRMGSKPSRASTPASEHCAARLPLLLADRFHGDSPADAGAGAGSPRSGRPRSSPTLIGQAGKSVAAKASGNAASRVSGNAPRAGTLVDHDQLWPWILPRRLRSSVFPDFG